MELFEAEIGLYRDVVRDGFAVFKGELTGDIDRAVVDDGGGIVPGGDGDGVGLDFLHWGSLHFEVGHQLVERWQNRLPAGVGVFLEVAKSVNIKPGGDSERVKIEALTDTYDSVVSEFV